jgi:predicted acylesterase/phospholipase RssA
MNSRPDVDDYRGKRYPVILVLAEGGGIRSAYITAMTLAMYEDNYPNFRHHVFAISGVSGGAFGSALFAALCIAGENHSLPMHASFTGYTNSVLSNDFLSGPLASLLGPEIIARFVPLSYFLPPFAVDRAGALELAFESAFKRVTGSDALQQSLRLSFDPNFHDFSSPLLLFNCTDVNTGNRVVLTPIKPPSDDAEYPLQADASSRIRISTASVLSARFPIISPVGYIRSADRTVAVVDGGYFDNTGSVTMAAVVRALAAITDTRSACVFKVLKPIYIEKSASKNGVTPSSWELGPILQALTAVLSAKSSSDREWLQAELAVRNEIDIEEPSTDISVEETGTNGKLPLGWFISKESRDWIRDQISKQLAEKPLP